MSTSSYPTTYYIEEILERYIPPFADRKNGLFLLPTQTGSGKTHAVANTIIKILKEHPGKKIHYLIGSRENRNEMYNLLMKNLEGDDALKDEVVLLKSNADHLIAFFSKYKNPHFQIIGRLKNYKDFKSSMEACVKLKDRETSYNVLSSIFRDAETKLKQDIRNEYAASKSDRQREALLKEVEAVIEDDKGSLKVIFKTNRYPIADSKFILDYYRNHDENKDGKWNPRRKEFRAYTAGLYDIVHYKDEDSFFYHVGYNRNDKLDSAKASPFREVKAAVGDVIIEPVLDSLDEYMVRNKDVTVLPFYMKYAREYAEIFNKGVTC